MAISTTSHLASLGTGYWTQLLEDTIFVAREESLMPGLVTGYSGRGYATRILPIYPALTAQTVAEGVDYSNPQTMSKSTQASWTPAVAMAQAILTDERLESDPDDAQRDATLELGRAIATKIDTDILGLFGSFTTGKGTAGSSLTLRHVGAALAKLRDNLAMGARTAVLHPYHWHDLWLELGQPAATQAFLGDTANEAMRQYTVGNLMSTTFMVSANISGVGTAYSAVFTREALALDTRKVPTMEIERDASARSFEINLHSGYGVGVRRADFGVYLVADATEPV